MNQVQSLTALLILLVLATFPAVWYYFIRGNLRPREDTRSEPLSSVLPAREAAARHLYGEAVGWSGEAMEDYDHSPLLQREWGREVDFLQKRRSRSLTRSSRA